MVRIGRDAVKHQTSAVLLPKVRSKILTDEAKFMPCAARISSFIPGHRCNTDEGAVVWAHLGSLGKGTSTKVSDLNGCAACGNCHDLIDGRDNRIWWIIKNYPVAFFERIMNARDESSGRLVEVGIITVKGGKIV